ncbi:response regulator transcription factor [Microbacteriaceae bacterium VKM Ac-2854]|nr:response regulator transcription factor [Microbacteriaceae bacterium VKM Ac-2854]
MIVDIVDDLPFIRAALAIALPETDAAVQLRVSAASWTEYSQSWARLSDVTVFRAELIDHVPAALKVRALAALDVAPIALLNAPAPPHEARLLQAGAVGIVYASDELATLIERITDPVRRVAAPPAPSSIDLSDRELQIACLYCGRSAPSAASLGRTLRLQERTVRRHLSRAREPFKLAGIDVSTRMKLRAALIEDGWLLPAL